MTISALSRAADSDRLGRALDLYRDLSVALSGQIARVKADTGGDADFKDPTDVLKAHQRALQSVHDAEASLVKRSRAEGYGGSGELDLDAARAEIRGRLALRAANG